MYSFSNVYVPLNLFQITVHTAQDASIGLFICSLIYEVQLTMQRNRACTDSYGEFTTNSNKNIQFGIFALWKTTK